MPHSPPKQNLETITTEGADAIVFSGGKAIRGPQSTGFIAGRRVLISSIAMQHLDMDVVRETWNPPAELFDMVSIDGVPRHGLGRGHKVGKEELVGFLVAFDLFLEEETDVLLEEWSERAERQCLVKDRAVRGIGWYATPRTAHRLRGALTA